MLVEDSYLPGSSCNSPFLKCKRTYKHRSYPCGGKWPDPPVALKAKPVWWWQMVTLSFQWVHEIIWEGYPPSGISNSSALLGFCFCWWAARHDKHSFLFTKYCELWAETWVSEGRKKRMSLGHQHSSGIKTGWGYYLTVILSILWEQKRTQHWACGKSVWNRCGPSHQIYPRMAVSWYRYKGYTYNYFCYSLNSLSYLHGHWQPSKLVTDNEAVYHQTPVKCSPQVGVTGCRIIGEIQFMQISSIAILLDSCSRAVGRWL